jgi:uncharacterized protein (UPF0332 family)
MGLKDWVSNGWLKPHKTTRQQICDLFAIVERDMEDAATGRLSCDWQFGIAYNAALKLCMVLMYAEGYRPETTLAHFRTIQALSEILGAQYKDDVDYLDACRSKRHKVEYDQVGLITQDEAKELLNYVKELKLTVMNWLVKSHKDIAP